MSKINDWAELQRLASLFGDDDPARDLLNKTRKRLKELETKNSTLTEELYQIRDKHMSCENRYNDIRHSYSDLESKLAVTREREKTLKDQLRVAELERRAKQKPTHGILQLGQMLWREIHR